MTVPPPCSRTVWSGTRVWTRRELSSMLHLTHSMGTASQLSYSSSERHRTTVSWTTLYEASMLTHTHVNTLAVAEILMRMVKARPSAVNHYCSFLKQLHAWKELTLVYQSVLYTHFTGSYCMQHLVCVIGSEKESYGRHTFVLFVS